MSKPKSKTENSTPEKEKKETVDFKSSYVVDFEETGREHIRGFINKVITITGYEIVNTRKGDMIVIYVLQDNELKEIFTFSKVVKRQLDNIQKTLQKTNVRARICYNEKGRYFYLKNPSSEC